MKLQLLKLLIMVALLMNNMQEAQICLRNPNFDFLQNLITAADRDVNLKQSITIKTSVDGKHEITAEVHRGNPQMHSTAGQRNAMQPRII